MLQSVKPKTEAKSSDDIFDLKQLNGIEDKMTRGLAKKIYIKSKREEKKSSEILTDIENELQDADKITDAMQNLINETLKRREMQKRYNLENNIIPQSIRKSIDEIMLTTSVANSAVEESFALSDEINFKELTKDEREMVLLDLRKEMIESAERLEFEKAAKIRDEIENIEQNIESVVL